MRPDEQANEAAVERDQRFRSNVATGFKTVASVAGGAVAARVAPFLSKYVPVDLAMKGLDKVSPKIADFLRKGQSMGLDLEEGMEYVKDTLSPKEQPQETENANLQEPAKENRNIIEQYSPNLYQYMQDMIKAGNSPIDAAAKSLKFLDNKQKNIIAKMEKDHKTDWSSIVQTVFGGQGMAPQQQAPEPKQSGLNPRFKQAAEKGQKAQEAFKSQQSQQEQPVQGQQPGNPEAKNQLLQAMQNLTSILRS